LSTPPRRKLTRRDRFLAEIDLAKPWGKLHKLIELHHRKVSGPGRSPIGLTRMLRMYAAQQCFGLSDEGIEDAIYDSQAIRAFVGIDLNREGAPDAKTLLGTDAEDFRGDQRTPGGQGIDDARRDHR
jgi:IS5 family transposase